MRLFSFKIKNVKSIVDSGVCYVSDKDGITVLAGQNEVGKSASLEGLDFFRNGPSEKFIKLSKRFDAHPFVICEFTIEDEDKVDGDEEIGKVLPGIDKISFSRGNEQDGSASTITFSEDSASVIKSIIEKKFQDGETADVVEQKRLEIYNQLQQHLLNRIPQFILFSTFEDLLPGEILIKDIPSNEAVLDFQKVFNIDIADVATKTTQERNSLIDAAERRATGDLNTYWSQVLTTAEDDKYNFKINLTPSTNPDESKIEFLVHRNDSRLLFMEQKSKGFQWFNAFNLRLKAIGVKKDELGNYVVLIDEPGQGLHETAQKDVKKVLEELASNGMQIIYTTHNACLIGVEGDEILRIRLVYQNDNKETIVQNIAQFSSNSTANNMDALSPIITAMGISSVGGLIDRDKICVVLEGITDHYYFSAMRQVLGIDDKYFFIPACGVQNLKPLVSIVISWSGNFKAVFDGGREGKSAYDAIKKYLYKNNEDLLEKHIHKMDNFEGIEDLFTKDDFDKFIVGDARADSSISNSVLAKSKKKELLARLFLEKVKTEDVSFSDETKTNFKTIFDWLNG
ncbi:MAG: hypothetical protein ACD_37C00574G0005 [uncultured bacterium]|nr:MAG: hypothetical protein ACD_37C00574G0005 [uncultured bacterium]